MSDDDDDYLANIDKFLVAEPSTSSGPKSYSQLRKEAEKKSHEKNVQNRTKGRRQREVESREEGLNKSLFARAKEDEDAGVTSGNKALSIMMKMGFKPGQTLGNSEDATEPVVAHDDETPTTSFKHKAEPLPINEWAGKRGIGLGTKRARSPSAAERVAKIAKMADDTQNRDFRDRARQEYEERRAEGRLGPAQRTCVSLDEKAGKAFNAFWVNPREPDTFPPGLLEALNLYTAYEAPSERDKGNQLRKQMAADALQPLGNPVDENNSTALDIQQQYSFEILEETAQFLRLQASDRLELVLSYLRETYWYCFWCGTQYENPELLESQCPGDTEDAHD
ncbi:G-patch domain-containing protein [Mycena kentingensis (nom. inval.)]|nr:G-patch domain-containing protein [Mycena kentingensis (nom. inval.)]